MVEAGAVRIERSGSLPQRKDALDQKQRAAQQAYIDIWPVKTVERTSETPPSGNKNAGVGLTPGNAQVGIFLVVLQQHVEVGLMVLDQIRLKNQGFRFTVSDDEFDLAHLTGHQANARRQVVTTAEITAHAAAQGLGFAHVKDAILTISHQVAAGF